MKQFGLYIFLVVMVPMQELYASDTLFINPAMAVTGTSLPGNLIYGDLKALHEGQYAGYIETRQSGEGSQFLPENFLAFEMEYSKAGVMGHFSGTDQQVPVLRNSLGQVCPMELEPAHGLAFVTKNGSLQDGGQIVEDHLMIFSFKFRDRKSCSWLGGGVLKLTIHPTSRLGAFVSFYFPTSLIYGPVKYCGDLSCPHQDIKTVGVGFKAYR